MEMWFSELHTSNVKLSMRIEKQLFSGNSDCQRIDVLESVEFGKFLALDGDILFSEKDEFIYDEMVTHVPMAVHPDVRHVLIIGGGDGGVGDYRICIGRHWCRISFHKRRGSRSWTVRRWTFGSCAWSTCSVACGMVLWLVCPMGSERHCRALQKGIWQDKERSVR